MCQVIERFEEEGCVSCLKGQEFVRNKEIWIIVVGKKSEIGVSQENMLDEEENLCMEIMIKVIVIMCVSSKMVDENMISKKKSYVVVEIVNEKVFIKIMVVGLIEEGVSIQNGQVIVFEMVLDVGQFISEVESIEEMNDVINQMKNVFYVMEINFEIKCFQSLILEQMIESSLFMIFVVQNKGLLKLNEQVVVINQKRIYSFVKMNGVLQVFEVFQIFGKIVSLQVIIDEKSEYGLSQVVQILKVVVGYQNQIMYVSVKIVVSILEVLSILNEQKINVYVIIVEIEKIIVDDDFMLSMR